MSILAALPFIGGVGFPELLIILVVVLILFGPKRLPQLGKSLGKTVKAIREGAEGKEDEAAVEASADDSEDTASEPVKAKAKKAEEATTE